MLALENKLKKVRTSIEAKKLLREEFLKGKYAKTRNGASEFQRDLEKTFPGINRWVLSWNWETGNEIEDIIMDEFKISGNTK